MRRILLLVALAASLLAVAPSAQASPPASKAAAEQAVVAHAETLRAAGFSLITHVDGKITGNKGWYNPENGRVYRFLFEVYVFHNTAGTWQPSIELWCTRTYGNLTVDSPCDFYGTFKAVVSPNGSSVSSVGSRPLRDINGDGSTTCKSGIVDEGTWRAYGSSYPWFMTYVENFQVDFLTATGCNHVHTTRQYDIGSKLVNGQTEAEITHDLTGIAG